jgi:PAS domain S-box-containing protein
MNEKVLIVDNSEAFLLPISRFLSSEGFEVRTATDGLEALDILEEFHPDYMFIDLVMPKLRGEKLCNIIKSKKDYQDIFLVILSGIAAEDISSCNDYGADACIAKGPFKKMQDYLLKVIKEKNNLTKGTILGMEDVYKREITQELLVSGKHNNIVLTNISDGILEIAVDGKILSANPKALHIFDKRESDILATDFFTLLPEGAKGPMHDLFEKAVEVRENEPVDYILAIEDRHIVVNVIYVEDHEVTIYIVVLRDITAYKKIEQDLTRSLEEKEVLLRETFHRIKNNLTMIASLINLESGRLSTKEDKSIFRDIISRIESISLIHEKLHHSIDMTTIDLSEYLKELVHNIFSVTAQPADSINIDLDIPSIKVSFNEVVPIALIVSELLTNAIKYGFPPEWEREKERKEEKRIFLTVSCQDNQCRLTFGDNGVGLPQDFSISSLNTLGLTLVETLTNQMEGKLELSRNGGAVFHITFPVNTHN